VKALALGFWLAIEQAVESNYTESVAQAVVAAFADSGDMGPLRPLFAKAFASKEARRGQCPSLVAVLTRTLPGSAILSMNQYAA
jgi:hypothetical protein